MFRHNPKAKYEPNGGRFLQKLTAKDFYQQQIVVSAKGSDSFNADDYFNVNFPNIFTNYMLGEMRVESPLFQHWESQPMKLWQTQLNFAVFCASSACGVSSAHLNYKKHSLVRAVYRFHVYYHIRRVLKRLQARANIVGTNASALTAQQIYLNNLENIVNRRVDFQEDIKRYQDTLNYASSKVDYSVGEGLYMLPSDMNLKIKQGVVGYNNEILISTGLVLGKNGGVNVEKKKIQIAHTIQSPKIVPPVNPKIAPRVEPKIQIRKSQLHPKPKIQLHKTPTFQSNINQNKITHEEEKIALILSLVAGFTLWRMF